MQISSFAKYLDSYLESRTKHPEIFNNLEEMVVRIAEVETALASASLLLTENPFVTAVYVVADGQVAYGDNLDRFRLFNTCLGYLAMAPVDEVSPQALRVFSKVARGVDNDMDKYRVARLITNLTGRASDLDGADQQALRDACRDCAQELRPLGFFPPEYEIEIARLATRTQGREMVEVLGFDLQNIPSMRNLPLQRQPVATAYGQP